MKVICVCSEKEILNGGLLSSAPAFLQKIELDIIDNTRAQFDSFASAVRSVIQKLRPNETLMFAHQDVLFYDPDTYQIIKQNIEKIHDNLFLAGVVGVRPLGGQIKSYGVNKIVSGGEMTPFAEIKEPTLVETIDECVMITNTQTIQKYNLFSDEKFHWHLYAVEASLVIARDGLHPYVLPLRLNHLSRGTCTPHYFDIGKCLLRKYSLKTIYTTNGPLTRCNVHTRKWKALVKPYLRLA
jgi:hypothetical protein